ncbi:hypothetical protein [Porphyromonas sp. COT-108 OH2963]|uniref:hypothetical protein n=1 Tax=Porphyromonas sp. COT-108 OH2963 TaxID=1515614 RepID=UPI00126A63C2|nr:hypothetical protein [Porphyromonas sp. COT-108 OH2963]
MAKKKYFCGQGKKIAWPRGEFFVAKGKNFCGQGEKFLWLRGKFFVAKRKNFCGQGGNFLWARGKYYVAKGEIFPCGKKFAPIRKELQITLRRDENKERKS